MFSRNYTLGVPGHIPENDPHPEGIRYIPEYDRKIRRLQQSNIARVCLAGNKIWGYPGTYRYILGGTRERTQVRPLLWGVPGYILTYDLHSGGYLGTYPSATDTTEGTRVHIRVQLPLWRVPGYIPEYDLHSAGYTSTYLSVTKFHD